MRARLFVLTGILVYAAIIITGCDDGQGSGGGSDPYMVPISGGDFIQSDGTNDFSHDISPFFIAKYEVTYDRWRTVYTWAIDLGRGTAVYAFAGQGCEGHDGTAGAAPTAAGNEPVTTVSWRDAIAWCNACSEMEGLVPVYYTDGTFTAPIRDSRDSNSAVCDAAAANWDANGYRLPTEGEWQYAAAYIDGTEWTPWNYASGDSEPEFSSTRIGNYAWFSENSEGKTRDAGMKTANVLRIHDMSGNVGEWCWDWYGAYPGDTTDYRGAAGGSNRVVRGGHWNVSGPAIRIGTRGMAYPYFKDGTTGFRLCRSAQ